MLRSQDELAMTNEKGIASSCRSRNDEREGDCFARIPRSRNDEEQKEYPTRPKNNIVKNIHKMYFFTGQAEKYVL